VALASAYDKTNLNLYFAPWRSLFVSFSKSRGKKPGFSEKTWFLTDFRRRICPNWVRENKVASSKSSCPEVRKIGWNTQKA